ncbi:MAG: hypothetical protein FJ096_15365 [Deltaproteobacteria bacterium]|nr:hypothetical protein [Deltaproteobacteria bacterium]
MLLGSSGTDAGLAATAGVVGLAAGVVGLAAGAVGLAAGAVGLAAGAAVGAVLAGVFVGVPGVGTLDAAGTGEAVTDAGGGVEPGPLAAALAWTLVGALGAASTDPPQPSPTVMTRIVRDRRMLIEPWHIVEDPRLTQVSAGSLGSA